MNLNRFKNKVAIVTGGSSGLGHAIVEEFCKEGGKVLFTGISERGIRVEKNFRKEGYDVTFLQGDMGLEEVCEETVSRTIETYGKIDCLVNNAFSFTAEGIDATKEDWMRSLNTGPVAFARMVQFTVPHMKANGGGAVVNISSISAYIAQIDRWTYNAAKGAVHQLTKCQALDLAPFNIRVNEIAPGWTWSNETDKAADLDGGGREKWGPIWGKYQMLNRMAQPFEIARPTLFMLSDDASFITGTTLDVDGGYLALGPEGLGETTVNAGSK
ncbi:SDR family oxidoreductase [Arenibacter echinorum]|uniref:NAD(P)-dependent dehydrogenase (Short-subunit alcohol dehydrogenase family) n=1 Tax=Arenibacter echinorum TaxID=440515 RepID=A0A327R8L8_9FLAO|nr:SDR family oxidoreductase [Arenibacter echinorum]RAJ10247.1 NAD(P)-dependent dehydrogenase (short-subunit alcohol dehydrogenase family) [Arenibacter echinorum]